MNPRLRPSYRAQQFFAAVLGRVTEDDLKEARRVLGPLLFDLFMGMPGQYRYHMLVVYRRVRDAGCKDSHVLKAALLHDAGKYDPESGKYVSLVYRVAIVLLKATAPGKRLLERLARFGETITYANSSLTANSMGWRYPFYLSKHHAELGARLAADYGADEDVIRLIAAHHRHVGHNPALAVLQAADEQS